VPTIYSIDPRLILIDTSDLNVKLILNEDMFRRTVEPPHALSKDQLRFISPEELLRERRSKSTVFWNIGVMMYEAHFKKNPFETSFTDKVIVKLIQKYPVLFPINMMQANLPELNDCIGELMNKDPTKRLGSESFYREVLDFIFFQ